jgi:hypothetical protein
MPFSDITWTAGRACFNAFKLAVVPEKRTVAYYWRKVAEISVSFLLNRECVKEFRKTSRFIISWNSIFELLLTVRRTERHGDANMRASAALRWGCATERYVYADRVCTACAVCGNPLFRWKKNGYGIHKSNEVRVKDRNITEGKRWNI